MYFHSAQNLFDAKFNGDWRLASIIHNLSNKIDVDKWNVEENVLKFYQLSDKIQFVEFADDHEFGRIWFEGVS